MKLNYKELAVLTDYPQTKCREIFKTHTGSKKVGVDVELSLTDLEKHFPPVHTMDERFDKMPFLEFCTKTKPLNYRQHLKNPAMIKACGFTNGHAVFYKILSDEQLEHAEKAFKHNHVHMYGEKSYNKIK